MSSIVPFYQGTPCNDSVIEESGTLVYRPGVIAIRAAIMRTVAHYPQPVIIAWAFSPTDATARENIAEAAKLTSQAVTYDGFTAYLE